MNKEEYYSDFDDLNRAIFELSKSLKEANEKIDALTARVTELEKVSGLIGWQPKQIEMETTTGDDVLPDFNS